MSVEQEKQKEAFGQLPAYSTYNVETVPAQAGPVPTPVGNQSFWSSKVFAASLCSVFCCGFFGVIATAMSIVAYVDHKFNDLAGVHRRQKIAKIFMILAFVAGTLIFIFCVARIVGMAIHDVNKMHDDDDSGEWHSESHEEW